MPEMATRTVAAGRFWLAGLRWSLGFLVVVFAAATVIVPPVLTHSREMVERSNRHDVAWTGARGRDEHQRLVIALYRAALTGAQNARDEAVLMHQIFVGRVATWRSGSFARFVSASAPRRQAFATLSGVMTALEEPMADLERPGAAAEALALAQSADAESAIEVLAGEAFIATNAEIDRTRSALLDLQSIQRLLLFGLLGCGLLLFALTAAQNRLLRRAHEEQRTIAERHSYVASHDVLTGLANRGTFRQALSALGGERVTVLAIDLDGFKPINDTHGHLAGDRLLVSIASRLARVVASHPGSVAARFGGDEFFVMLRGLDAAAADGVAREIMRRLRKPHRLDDRSVLVGATIGRADGEAGLDGGDRLLSQADLALNRAKAGGKNTIVRYEPAMGAEADEKRRIEEEIAQALEKGEFEPWYQPQIDMPTGDIVAVEALVRWNHPKHGLLTPGAFIEVAESCGAILEIGRVMVEKACQDAAGFPEPIGVSVNLSAIQLMRTDVPALVADCLARSGLAPERLTLEITETVLMRDAARCQEMILRLREMGVSVALDDFGTGYSSLSYLHGFGFDEMKIDRSFVAALTEREQSLAIVHTIVTLGRNLGLAVVAEGVETPEQAALLMATGCRVGQGWLYGRAVPAREISTRLMKAKAGIVPPLLEFSAVA